MRPRELGVAVIGAAGVGLAIALAAVAALTTFVATAGPREIATAQSNSVTRAAQLTPLSGSAIFVDANWVPQLGGSGVMTSNQASAFSQSAGSGIVRPVRLVPGGSRTWITGPARQLTKAAPSAILTGLPSIQLSYDSGLAADARLVAGHWPQAAGTGLPGGSSADKHALVLQVAVTPPTAARYGLHVGSIMPLGQVAGRLTGLLVTAIVQPSPSAYFWQSSLVLPAPTLIGLTTARNWDSGALVSSAELAAMQRLWPGGNVQGSWYYPVDLSHLTPGLLTPTETAVSALIVSNEAQTSATVTGFTFAQSPTMSSQLPGQLAAIQAELTSTGTIDSLVLAGLFAAGLLLMLLCAGLAADRYEAEFRLIRARGGSVAQITRLALARSLGAIGMGAVIGFVAATLAVAAPPGSHYLWVLAVVTAVVGVAAVPTRSAWMLRGAVPPAGRRADILAPRRSGRRVVAELTVLAAGVAAVVALRVRGLGSGGDLAEVSPLLVAAAASIGIARLYPVPVRALLPVAIRRRGPVGFIGLAKAGRSGLGAILPALALVLTLTLAAFSWMVTQSVNSGQATTAWQQVGADAVVNAVVNVPEYAGIPVSAQRAIDGVPGVRHSTLVYETARSTAFAPSLYPSANRSFAVGLLVVNPREYAAVARGTPWPRFPAGVLGHRAGPVPILISDPVAAAEPGHGYVGAREVLELAGTDMHVVVAGTISATPAFPAGGAYVVLPQWAAAQFPSIAGPSTVLVTGPGLSAATLTAVVARHLPGAQIVVRSQVLAALHNSASGYAVRLFVLSVWAAAALSAVALFFGLAATARGRRLLRSRLSALGMSAGQARALALTDPISLLSVAVLGMVTAGSVLVLISAQTVNLGPLIGAVGAVGVTMNLPALLIPAIVAVAAALAAAAIENRLAERAGTASALRTEEAN
jgi:putative ABC transport system permease protein